MLRLTQNLRLQKFENNCCFGDIEAFSEWITTISDCHLGETNDDFIEIEIPRQSYCNNSE